MPIPTEQALLTKISADSAFNLPVSIGENAHILEDLVAEAPHVQVVADVLHQLQDQLRLVQGHHVCPRLFPDLAGQLDVAAAGRRQERRRPVDGGDEGLEQAALLELVGGDLADRRRFARAGGPAAKDEPATVRPDQSYGGGSEKAAKTAVCMHENRTSLPAQRHFGGGITAAAAAARGGARQRRQGGGRGAARRQSVRKEPGVDHGTRGFAYEVVLKEVRVLVQHGLHVGQLGAATAQHRTTG